MVVEGYCSLDEALVCGGRSADGCEPEPFRGGNSRVNWHSDLEPLFGRSGVHKLIVSVSFGAPVLFKWRGKSCLDSEERSCWLGHGDTLVMDGQCQVEFLHCSSPGLEHGRIKRKVHLFMLRGILGLAVIGLSGFFFVLCARWRYWVWFFTSWGVQGLGLVGVPFIGRAPWAKVGWGITYMITGKKA